MLHETVSLGVFSLLLLTTYSSYSTIITKIHEEEGEQFRNLGPILLACSYGSFMIMNSFTPSISLSYKRQFIIAAILYALSYALVIPQFGVQMMYAASILGVILGGIGASFFNISYGAYMDLLCTQQSTPQRGKYFGILNGFIFANLILGAIITTFSLGFFSNQIYYIILTVIGLIALVFGWVYIRDIQQTQQEILHLKDKKGKSCKQIILRPLSFYPRMSAVLLLLIIDGVSMGFLASTILHLIPPSGDRATDNIKAGVLQIILGIGAIFGGYSSGFLTDKIQVVWIGISSLICIIITSLITFAAVYAKQYWTACVCGFFWGTSLYYLEGWMLVTCSKVYGGSPETFAVNKQVHSLSFVIFQIIVIATNDNLNIYYLAGFIILLCIPAIYMLCYLPKQRIQPDTKHSTLTEQQAKQAQIVHEHQFPNRSDIN